VSVNPANSIYNRLDKVLEHLVNTYDEENWSQFLGDDDKLDWSRTVLVGSSLGAGQAALIAEKRTVYRVGLLHGWTDANDEWVKLGLTPKDHFFALIHWRDGFFRRTCFAYLELELVAGCPLAEFPNPLVPFDPNPALVEHRPGPPFDTPQLVFNLEPNSFLLEDPWHSSTSRDGWIAREADGTPSKTLLNAWRAVLGDQDGDTCLDEVDGDPNVPNAADTDDDAEASALCTPAPGTRSGIGDTTVRCDASDAAGNTAGVSFVVTVLGAKEQLANLIREVVDSSRLPTATKAQLIASLQSLLAGFDPSKPSQRAAACLTLRAFSLVVQFVAPVPAAGRMDRRREPRQGGAGLLVVPRRNVSTACTRRLSVGRAGRSSLRKMLRTCDSTVFWLR